jgi:hypothetical protein
MKYLFDKPLTYDCLYEEEVPLTSVSNKFTKIAEASALTLDVNTNSLTEERKFYSTYTSPYSGAFNLLDTLRIPRACAYET